MPFPPNLMTPMNNQQLAREAVAQICDIQSKRMDESFHINAENARAMFEAIVLDALDKATARTPDHADGL